MTTGIFLTFTSDRVGIVRRRAAGANPGRNDGNGGNMSMLRYYTNDSPGLKITPVCLVHEAPVRTRPVLITIKTWASYLQDE